MPSFTNTHHFSPETIWFIFLPWNTTETHITPREIIRDFIELINILYQNPQKSVADILGSRDFSMAKGGLDGEKELQEEFQEFEV